MALARTRRGESGMNYWPGFVDALSTLILGIIFLLTIFVVVQFYLQQEVAGKDTALTRLNAQIAQLTELLSMEKTGKANLQDQLAQLQASLATAKTTATSTRAMPKAPAPAAARHRARCPNSSGQLEGEKKISANALAQVEVLNQQIAALRRQLAAIEAGARCFGAKGQGIAERASPTSASGSIVALAQKVQELTQVPLRLLRQAARNPRQPARRAHRR